MKSTQEKTPLIVPVLASAAAVLVIIGIFGAIGADSGSQRLAILKTCGTLAMAAWAASEIVRILDGISSDLRERERKGSGESPAHRK
jgi:hypothetical protein